MSAHNPITSFKKENNNNNNNNPIALERAMQQRATTQPHSKRSTSSSLDTHPTAFRWPIAQTRRSFLEEHDGFVREADFSPERRREDPEPHAEKTIKNK